VSRPGGQLVKTTSNGVGQVWDRRSNWLDTLLYSYPEYQLTMIFQEVIPSIRLPSTRQPLKTPYVSARVSRFSVVGTGISMPLRATPISSSFYQYTIEFHKMIFDGL
jgi:hypothetical protein